METARELDLPVDHKSVRHARRFVAEHDDLASPRLDDALLVVSELVTNALLHAGLGPSDRIVLTIALDDRSLRIDVDDGGTFTARAETFTYTEAGQRLHGLDLVKLLANRWQAHDGRVTAWLDLEKNHDAV